MTCASGESASVLRGVLASGRIAAMGPHAKSLFFDLETCPPTAHLNGLDRDKLIEDLKQPSQGKSPCYPQPNDAASATTP
jgi:hypothetical protein